MEDPRELPLLWALCAAASAVLFYFLRSGRILTDRPLRWVGKSEEPGVYWTTIGLFGLALFVGTFVTLYRSVPWPPDRSREPRWQVSSVTPESVSVLSTPGAAGPYRMVIEVIRLRQPAGLRPREQQLTFEFDCARRLYRYGDDMKTFADGYRQRDPPDPNPPALPLRSPEDRMLFAQACGPKLLEGPRYADLEAAFSAAR